MPSPSDPGRHNSDHHVELSPPRGYNLAYGSPVHPRQRARNGRLHTRRTAAPRRPGREAEYQRKPLSTQRPGDEGAGFGRTGDAAAIPQPDGGRLSRRRRKTARCDARHDPGRQRQRRHPHHRHPRLPWVPAAGLRSPIRPIHFIPSWPGCRMRRPVPVPWEAELVAAGSRRCIATGPTRSTWPIPTPPAARFVEAGGRLTPGGGFSRAAPDRRSVRRFRRQELPGPGARACQRCHLPHAEQSLLTGRACASGTRWPRHRSSPR